MQIVQSLLLAVVALFGMSMAQPQFRGSVSTSELLSNNNNPPSAKPTMIPTNLPIAAPVVTLGNLQSNYFHGGCDVVNGMYPASGTVFGIVKDTNTNTLHWAICDGVYGPDVAAGTNLDTKLVTYKFKKIGTDTTTLYAYGVQQFLSGAGGGNKK